MKERGPVRVHSTKAPCKIGMAELRITNAKRQVLPATEMMKAGRKLLTSARRNEVNVESFWDYM